VVSLKSENRNIFQRVNDILLESVVDAAVFIYKLFARKKTMNDQPTQDGSKEGKGEGAPKMGKIIMAQSSHDVKFADFAQIVLTPTHGIMKFGLHQAGTDEFIVHTQIVMPPQALTGFAEGLKKQIDLIKEKHAKPPTSPMEP